MGCGGKERNQLHPFKMNVGYLSASGANASSLKENYGLVQKQATRPLPNVALMSASNAHIENDPQEIFVKTVIYVSVAAVPSTSDC